MEEFSEFSGDLVEFPSTWKAEKSKTLTNKSTSTDPIPELKSLTVQTNKNKTIEIQTDSTCTNFTEVNEKTLATWLKKIYPLIEFELLQGVTPLWDTSSLNTADEDIHILPYQRILLDPAGGNILSSSNIQGIATWLSIKTNNAPMLVLTTLPVHNDWCNHINPTIKLFTPKRIQNQDYIAFSELTTIIVKACIKSLCTNPFNKDIFVGGTVSGDLYIWKYSTDNNNSGEIIELFCENVEYGCIIAIDWLSEFNFLTCHENGIVIIWKIGKEIVKDKEFKIVGKEEDSKIRLSTILALSTTDFLLGSAEGNVFFCSNSNTNRKIDKYFNPVVMELEKHIFSVISLNKTTFSDTEIIVSCDLSGEIYFYDITNSEEGPSLIVKMPLPFKNSIAFSKNGNFIMCPGIDGSLDVFRTNNGNSFTVSGYENGKGNFIKISENGSILKSFQGMDNYWNLQWNIPNI